MGMAEPSSRIVTADDGVHLHLTDHGVDHDGEGPTVLLVHGYPDTSRVWDEVVTAIGERARVVTFDVRGAGRSDRPRGRRAYRLEQLATDLRTVIDAISPDAPVHLVGHDWGAIQSFEAVCLPWAADRIASFTCISGASFDEAGRGFRRGLRRPDRVPATLSRLSRSWYIGLFQLPVLPERTFRSGLGARLLQALEGLPPREGHPAETAVEDAVAGLALYRANLGRVLRPQRERAVVPTQVVVGHSRHVTGHHQPEAAGADVPAHDVDRVGEQPAAGREYRRPRRGGGVGRGAMGAGADDGGRAVPEQADADERGDGGVVALQGE